MTRMGLTPEQDEQVKKAREIILRSAGRREFPELVMSMMIPGVVVHADRGVGKTEALITAVHEREDGNAIIVVPTAFDAEFTLLHYRNAFLSYGYGGREPIVKAAHDSETFRGLLTPIYCDDWWRIPSRYRYFLAKSSLVKGAVGTMPGLAGCIEAFPLIEARDAHSVDRQTRVLQRS
jgi:hypothetical protein